MCRDSEWTCRDIEWMHTNPEGMCQDTDWSCMVTAIINVDIGETSQTSSLFFFIRNCKLAYRYVSMNIQQ